jgi:glycosyltransferase involved in cell wall biosynthesis
MKVALVCETAPCPANSGSRLRILHLLLPLVDRHEITLIFRANDTAEVEATRAELEPRGVKVVPVLDPMQVKSGPAFYAQLGLNLFSSLPYSIVSHNSPGVRAAIAEVARQGIDVWHLEWISYADAVRTIPGAKLVITAHDVVSCIWERRYNTAPPGLKRWYIHQQWKKFRAYESAVYSSVDVAITVTQEDVQRLRQLSNPPRIEVVDNGVDFASYAAIERQPQQRTIIYIGALDSQANQDAAVALLEEVFPAVREKYPDSKLQLIGRGPPDWLTRQCQSVPGAEMHANVPDVKPYLARASVLAVSLRVGGGSRLKILEALAAGVPVVSTRVGAEGLHVADDRELLLVDQPRELVSAVEQVWEDPTGAQRRVEAGRELARDRYDWKSLALKQEQVWLSV